MEQQPARLLDGRQSSHRIARKPLPPLPPPLEDTLPLPRPVTPLATTQRRCLPCTGWGPEVASFVFALLVFAAIVLLLALRDGKPLPNWPSVLGINSLLAIFGSLFKVALLYPVTQAISERKWFWFSTPHPVSDFDRFDSATRSPWGAFGLLFVPAITAATKIGALIVILALAVDPFTQQVLQFYTCVLPVDGAAAATISRTNNYTIGGGVFEDFGPWLTTQMTAAIYQGMLDPPANSSVAASAAASAYCSTGNCTFPQTAGVAFSSLAACSNVEDISNLVTGNFSLGPQPTDPKEWSWNYQLPAPNNLSINASSAMATAQVNDNSNTSIFQFEALMVTMNCTNLTQLHTDGTGCPVLPRAFRVSILPCVINYGNVSYSNSFYQEFVVSNEAIPPSGRNFALAGKYSSVPDVDCTPSTRPQGKKTHFTSEVYDTSTQSSGRCVSGFLEDCNTNFTDPLYYDPACVFSLGGDPAGGMFTALNKLFGTITPSPNQLYTTTASGPNTYIIGEGIFERGNGDTWMANLWANGTANLSSVSALMSGLTTSMTAAMRQQGDASNSQPAIGTVLGAQTCVGVTWPWLALPALLLVASALFFAATVVESRVQTRQKGTPDEGREPWKSSALPLLWCGLPDSTRARYHMVNLYEMKECADETRVRLRRRRGMTAEAGFASKDGDTEQGGWLLDSDDEAPMNLPTTYGIAVDGHPQR